MNSEVFSFSGEQSCCRHSNPIPKQHFLSPRRSCFIKIYCSPTSLSTFYGNYQDENHKGKGFCKIVCIPSPPSEALLIGSNPDIYKLVDGISLESSAFCKPLRCNHLCKFVKQISFCLRHQPAPSKQFTIVNNCNFRYGGFAL